MLLCLSFVFEADAGIFDQIRKLARAHAARPNLFFVGREKRFQGRNVASVSKINFSDF